MKKRILTCLLMGGCVITTFLPSVCMAGNVKKLYVNVSKEGNQAQSSDIPSQYGQIENATKNVTFNLGGYQYNGILVEAQKTPSEGLQLDGINDYVKVGNAMAGLRDFTVSVWMKSDQVTASPYRYNDPAIFGTKQGGGDTDDFVITNYNGNLAFYGELGGTGSYTTSKKIADNAWHYVTAVRSGSNLTAYIDGIVAGSYTIGGDPIRNDEIQFGLGQWSGSMYLKGNIRAVSIWKQAMDVNQVKKQMEIAYPTLDEFLVGHWKF